MIPLPAVAPETATHGQQPFSAKTRRRAHPSTPTAEKKSSSKQEKPRPRDPDPDAELIPHPNCRQQRRQRRQRRFHPLQPPSRRQRSSSSQPPSRRRQPFSSPIFKVPSSSKSASQGYKMHFVFESLFCKNGQELAVLILWV